MRGMFQIHNILAALALSTALVPAAVLAAVPHASDALVPHPAAIRLGAAADRTMTVVLALPLRHPLAAANFVAHVTRIGDPLYRAFLTPEEFGRRYGADPAAYAALSSWAVGMGLAPGEASISHTVLTLSGRTSQIEAAFGVKLSDFRTKDGRVFTAADRDPVPAGAPAVPFSVLGLSGYNHFAQLARIKPAGVPVRAQGSGPGGAYNAADLRSLYAVLPQTPSAKTETVAVFEQGGFAATDVARYFHDNGLHAIPVQARDVNGYGGGVDDPGVELEAVLDIDMVAALNPAVRQILVYEDGTDSFGVSLLAALTAMANDHKAETISISYGLDEVEQGNTQIAAEGPLFVQLAAQGQQVFVSSGDQGAYGRSGTGLNAPDPGSQPYVTSVGGTTLFSYGASNYGGEEVWNDIGLGLGATGGGVSSYWPIPAYQLNGTTSVATANGGSATMRNVPDVAAVANPATGVAVYSALNGGWITIGGTSVSSPLWAGYYSLLNAANKGLGLGRLGFFNPALYSYAPNYEGFDIHDIVDGSNGNTALFGTPGFNAGFSYDNTTGWGSPYGTGFLLDFTVGVLLGGAAPPPPPNGFNGTTTATTASIHWTASKGATGYLVLAQDLTAFQPLIVQITKDTVEAFTGLTPSSQYAFTVYATDPTGSAGSSIYLATPKR
jgi:kumamolisin